MSERASACNKVTSPLSYEILTVVRTAGWRQLLPVVYDNKAVMTSSQTTNNRALDALAGVKQLRIGVNITGNKRRKVVSKQLRPVRQCWGGEGGTLRASWLQPGPARRLLVRASAATLAQSLNMGHCYTRSIKMFSAPRHRILSKSAPQKALNRDKAEFATKVRKSS